MSDDSLFSRHLRLISEDQSTWTQRDREEYERLQKIDLPKLQLPLRKASPPAMVESVPPLSLWERYKVQLQWGLGALAVASVVSVVSVPTMNPGPMNPGQDTLTAKGALQISVFWQRDGQVYPFTETSKLKDGDRIEASVVSSEYAVSYWAITDENFKIIIGTEEKSGQSPNVSSSFELVAPNQGENLVVVACPKSMPDSGKKAIGSLLNREFLAQLLNERRLDSKDCIYAGFKLRSRP
jgi:hypothetical protein